LGASITRRQPLAEDDIEIDALRVSSTIPVTNERSIEFVQ
jgi:hypothetical protein